jgi:ligand-binding sensor domain-containing protein/signal transduction histidine kinase
MTKNGGRHRFSATCLRRPSIPALRFLLPFAPHTNRHIISLLLILTAVTLENLARGMQQVQVQELVLRNWDLDDGLPSTRVNAVARTRDGFVWLATYGGLARFDGQKFSAWSQQEVAALKGTRISQVFTDTAGQLWVGTATGGFGRWMGENFAPVALGETVANKGISKITQDKAGAIWVATDGAGIVRWSTNGIHLFATEQGLPSLEVIDLLCDTSGNLWAVSGGRLLHLQDGKWIVAPGWESSHGRVTAIAPARDGGLWVGTSTTTTAQPNFSRVFRWHQGDWREVSGTYLWPQGSGRARIDALLEDRAGQLWCATAGHGVFILIKSGAWKRLVNEAPLSQLEGICLVQDEDNAVWIGTRTTGLHQAHPRPVQTIHLPAAFPHNVVLSCAVDSATNLWMGTDGAGIFRWDGQELLHFDEARGVSNLTIRVLFHDRHANLWAGTQAGLLFLTNAQFVAVTETPALKRRIDSITEDRQGRIWFATQGGLVCWSNGPVSVYGSRQGLPRTAPQILAVDPQNRIWAACGTDGLFEQIAPDGSFRHNAVVPAPGQRNIRALHFTPDGALWIGTEGFALIRLFDGKAVTYTYQDDGLPSNHHFGMLADSSGHLWVSSENGIFGFAPQALENFVRSSNLRVPVWRLTPNEGLLQKVCTGAGQPTATRSPDGRLWFPNGHAVAMFDPSMIPRSLHAWPPVIIKIVVAGAEKKPAASSTLSIPSSARQFEFHYTSPNMVAPDRVRFRFKLEGSESDWVEAGSRRTAYYNRLPPGDYQFKVEATGTDEIWQPLAQPMQLIIEPQFYERPAVQAGFVLLFLASIAAIVASIQRARYRRRMARLQMQRAMDQERQRIARDIHDDLGSGLTEIILLSDTLEAEKPGTAIGQPMVEEISRRARALTRAMDEVVWAINPRNDTLESFLTYLNRWAQSYLTHANVRCRWDVPVDLPDTPLPAETRHHLFLSCKEAINNIVKHARATEVWVRFTLTAEELELRIEDNGTGLPPVEQRKFGNGLANMQRRLEELGGRFTFTSEAGRGVRIKFALPCRRTVPPA